MEKDRSSKIIAIVALAVAVFGVSLGFAAFSNELTIQPAAVVKGDASKFDVEFSTVNSAATPGAVEPELTPEEDGFTAESATLAATTVSNIKATFQNGKGQQTVKYSFYVYNNGELDAYLKKVTFGNTTPKCTAKTGTSAELVEAACGDVSMKISINGTEYEETNDAIASQELAVDSEGQAVIVTLEYNDTNPVDGDFDVDFGSITLNYSSSDKAE